jgi:hypothetical protein
MSQVKFIVCLTAWACAMPAFAKGMQDLAQTEGKTESATEPAAEPAEAAKTNEPADAETTDDEAKELPQTAASKALADRLSIRTGLGLGSIQADGENWRSLGMGELGVGFALSKMAGLNVAMTFRYVPADVRPQLDEQSYVGVVEAYHFGATVRHPGIVSGNAFASAELGLMSIHLHDSDPVPNEDDPPTSGFNVTLGGGIDWAVLDKVRAGPTVYVGFGSFSTLQVGGSAAFVF